MRGPFGIVVAAALALLVIGLFFSVAPAIGGSAEEASPLLGVKEQITLLNRTNVSTNHRNIGNVVVYNETTCTNASRIITGSNFVYDSAQGTITLWNIVGKPNYNGSYCAYYDYSQWASTVNTDMVDGGDWFADNATWVTLAFLGIVAAIIVGLFMRW